jgi:hypothetical protein
LGENPKCSGQTLMFIKAKQIVDISSGITEEVLIPIVHIRAYNITSSTIYTADGHFLVDKGIMDEWVKLTKQDVFDPKAIKIAPIGIVKGG